MHGVVGMRVATILLISVLSVSGLLGCTQESEFVGPNGLYAFAMTEQTPPYFMSDEAELFLVETRIELPIEIPTDDEMAELMAAPTAPFPRAPWVTLDDLAIEVDLSVTNLMDADRSITLVINGFNEFHEYLPGFTVDDDEVIPDFSMWERAIRIEAGETIQWTVREEELDEVAVDLATVVNGAPNANEVVYFENQSAIDPRSQPYIPAVIPGLTGFRLGIMAEGASNIVVEASVRVRDVNDRLADVEDMEEWWVLPTPMIFMPAMMMMN